MNLNSFSNSYEYLARLVLRSRLSLIMQDLNPDEIFRSSDEPPPLVGVKLL